MKILIADKFPSAGVDALTAIGCEVTVNPDLKDEALVAAVSESGADILVVRSTKVTEPMLEAGRLSLVVRAGAGYNTIDVKAASARGIYVSNCPGKNSVAVAERSGFCWRSIGESRTTWPTYAAGSGTRRSTGKRTGCLGARSA